MASCEICIKRFLISTLSANIRHC